MLNVYQNWPKLDEICTVPYFTMFFRLSEILRECWDMRDRTISTGTDVNVRNNVNGEYEFPEDRCGCAHKCHAMYPSKLRLFVRTHGTNYRPLIRQSSHCCWWYAQLVRYTISDSAPTTNYWIHYDTWWDGDVFNFWTVIENQFIISGIRK